MAKVYSPPKEFEEKLPRIQEFKIDKGGRFKGVDFDAYTKAEDKWVEELKKIVPSDHELAGEVLHFSVADGYAKYMVWKLRPLTLVHLPLGDAYIIPEAHERGLQVSDVKEQIERRKKWKELTKDK